MSSQVEQTLPGGPPSPVRDWLAWAAVWTLVLHSPMWIAVGIDSVEERSNPTMEATPVAEWVPVLGTVTEVVGDQQRAQTRLWARGFAVLAVGIIGAYAMLLLYQVVVRGAAA